MLDACHGTRLGPQHPLRIESAALRPMLPRSSMRVSRSGKREAVNPHCATLLSRLAGRIPCIAYRNRWHRSLSGSRSRYETGFLPRLCVSLPSSLVHRQPTYYNSRLPRSSIALEGQEDCPDLGKHSQSGESLLAIAWAKIHRWEERAARKANVLGLAVITAARLMLCPNSGETRVV